MVMRELAVELSRQAAQEGGRHEDRGQHQHDGDQRCRRPRPSSGGPPPRAGAFRRCRSTFSTTTIASSTTMPMASTRPNSVSLLMENPNAAMTAKVPTSETGMATIGIIDGAPALQEDEHHQHHQHDRLEQGVHQFVDRVGDEDRRVVGDLVRDPLGKSLLSPPWPGRSAVARAFAPGRCRTAIATAGFAEEAAGGVVQRAEFDPRHVLDAHQRPSAEA